MRPLRCSDFRRRAAWAQPVKPPQSHPSRVPSPASGERMGGFATDIGHCRGLAAASTRGESVRAAVAGGLACLPANPDEAVGRHGASVLESISLCLEVAEGEITFGAGLGAVAADLARPGLPCTPVSTKDLFCNHLEQGIVRWEGSTVSGCGKHRLFVAGPRRD